MGRSDRGTTLVEYALFVSLVATSSLGTIEMIDDDIETHYKESAADIGQPDLTAFDVTTTTSGDGDTTTTTTTTAAPTTTSTTTTTTTTAPATTSTTSTTTTSTTTTSTTTTSTTSTSTTTTTAAVNEDASVGYSDRSGWRSDGTARAKVRLSLDDDSGADLEDADVSVTFTLSDGSTETVSGSTNDRGRVVFQWSNLDGDDFPVVVTIDTIEKDGTSYTPSLGAYTLSL